MNLGAILGGLGGAGLGYAVGGSPTAAIAGAGLGGGMGSMVGSGGMGLGGAMTGAATGASAMLPMLLAQQKNQLPAQQFSMPQQSVSPVQSGQSSPGYQQALAQALAQYGGQTPAQAVSQYGGA